MQFFKYLDDIEHNLNAMLILGAVSVISLQIKLPVLALLYFGFCGQTVFPVSYHFTHKKTPYC